MNKKIIVKNLNETIDFAFDFAKNLKAKDIVCLTGDLGVGKSVIARSICRFFDVDNKVVSPTFNILKTYKIINKNIKAINHFDLYRIKSVYELMNIGFEDYIYEEKVLNLIEWPEIAFDILPSDTININIKRINDNTREIYINV